LKRNDPFGAVGIVGLGHVGLCTAVCLASRGIETVGVDMDEERVRSVAGGRPPFIEEALPRTLVKVIKNGKLRATSDYSELGDTDYQFITVPTPSSEDGAIDLAHVRSAVDSVGKSLKHSTGYKVVVIKSTVTPGTTLMEVLPALEAGTGKKLGEFGLASNPEFLREGHAIEDTLKPDRLVIGTEERRSQRSLLTLCRRLYGNLPETVLTTTLNAELIKYASNAYLATKITFINEIANLCSKLQGADVSVVARGIGLDQRIGPSFLKAGLGYGGSCLPKDVNALLKVAESKDVRLGVVKAATEGNKEQAFVAARVAEELVGGLRGRRVALLGLAFKPDTDDMRDAASLRLISELVAKGAAIVAYDPAAMENAKKIIGDGIEYADSAQHCLKGADCCILVTEWPEFSKLLPEEFKRLMRTPAIVDGRRVLNPEQFRASGVGFAAIGLGAQWA